MGEAVAFLHFVINSISKVDRPHFPRVLFFQAIRYKLPSFCNVRLVEFSEIPAREGWVCDFESGQICLNFRMSGWMYFSPAQHSADTQYEPEVDHTSGRDSG